MIKTKKQMFMVIGIFALILALTTVTYGFFNYTRTGAINNLGTGRIYFNSTQGDTLNITNIFPMTSSEAGSATLDTVTVGIVGDTTYSDGEEYEIKLVDVTNTVNGKKIPINFIATYTAASGGTIGNSSDTYWEARNSKNASIYTLNTSGEVKEGKQVLVGYIDNGATGISGTLTIKAYIDADRIAITDTPDENTEWQRGRAVFSTEEWNSLGSNPISFKIRAESNEGIWVEEPSKVIESCPDCKFMYTTNVTWTTWNGQETTPTQITSGLYDNYEELIATTGKNYFLGVKLNNNNEATNAYACGLYNNTTSFCIEGYYDNSKYASNQEILQNEYLWNNTCYVDGDLTDGDTSCQAPSSGLVYSNAFSDGRVYAGVDADGNCYVSSHGQVYCGDGAD